MTEGTKIRVIRTTNAARLAWLLGLCLVAVMAYGPYAFLSRGNEQDLTTLFTYVILGTMWNLLAGYAGLVSIGQQAFIGFGAYGLVYAADIVGIGTLAAIPVAMVMSGVIAYLASFLAFRLAGGYFAIGTWVMAEVARLLVSQIDTLGAGAGISLASFSGTSPNVRIAIVFWTSMVGAVLSVVVTYLLLRSRLGAGFTALRDEPTAAATLGVNVTRSKRIVWTVAAMGCAMAGALQATNTLNVTPDSVFSVQWSAFMIFMVVIGGIGTIEGPIIGAVTFFALEQQFQDLGSWYLIILGLVAILVVLFLPRGLWGLISGRGRVRLFPTGYQLVAGPDLQKGAAAGSLQQTPQTRTLT